MSTSPLRDAPTPRMPAPLRPTPSAAAVHAPIRLAPHARLPRACRRVLGWLAPRQVALRCVRRLGAPAASTVAHDWLPRHGARRMWLQLEDRTLKLDLWGDPDRRPFVLLATSSQATDATAFAPWLQALTSAGRAVVAFERVPRRDASNEPATLPELAADLCAIGRRFGRADAVIGHGQDAAATVLAASLGLETRRMILLCAQADPREAIARLARRIGVGEAVGRHMATLLEDRMGVALDDLQAHRIAPAVAAPALVVHDLLDDEVPWAEGERFARHLPEGRLLTTRGLGHHGVPGDPDVLHDCMCFLAGDTIGDRVVSSPNLPYGIA